jgi:hypothetical protein
VAAGGVLVAFLVAALAAVAVYGGGPAAPPRVEAKSPRPPLPDLPAPAHRRVEPASGELVAATPPAAKPPTDPPSIPVTSAAPAAETHAVTPAPAVPEAPRPEIALRHWTEEELLASLNVQAVGVDLEATPGTGAKLLKTAREPIRLDLKKATPAARDAALQEHRHPLLSLALRRPDLAGLPLLKGCDCYVGDGEAQEEVSRAFRRATVELDRRAEKPRARDEGPPSSELSDRARGLIDLLTSREEWAKDDSRIPTLVQILQVEETPVRLRLVKWIAQIKGEQAGAALARRALFDVTPEVRAAATEALKGRPPEEFRAVLLDGFRHPWPPAAEHAAEVLIALNDRSALPDLTRLLDGPDPAAPVRGADGRWRMTELVRVNHLGNCLLCHAPSASGDDDHGGATGLVPRRGEPLPRLYYDGQDGDFARADVTYLRQDFSLMQEVSKSGKWPAVQRFDYLVRTRELTAKEAFDRLQKPAGARVDSAQRQALYFTVRQLSGADAEAEAGPKRQRAKDEAPGP